MNSRGHMNYNEKQSSEWEWVLTNSVYRGYRAQE